MDVPFRRLDPSPTGAIHLFSASLSTFLFPFAALLMTRGFRNDECWLPFYPRSRGLAVVVLAIMPIVFAVGMLYFQLFGLIQKVYALLVLSWMMATAIRLHRVVRTVPE
jgi:hypothetical protein